MAALSCSVAVHTEQSVKELCEGGRTTLIVIIVEVWRSALRFEELALLCFVRVQWPKVTV